MDVIIYHNPACSTSRNVLGLIRNAGVEPHIIDYLRSPPSRIMLIHLIANMGLSPRQLLRENKELYVRHGLSDPLCNDSQILAAMMDDPILINRPIVVSPKGVRLCRPSERVLDLLPPQRGEFFKEDGERIIDQHGRQVATA